MLAIGSGGLDVAAAMAGEPFYLPMPRMTLVNLTGRLQPWVSAKDVILEVLRIISVKGGVGRIIEYGGPGVAGLLATDRATITNMGAELGATSSIFPSDDITRRFMASRTASTSGARFRPMQAQKMIRLLIKLDTLEPISPAAHAGQRGKSC